MAVVSNSSASGNQIVRIAFWHFYTFRLLRGIETLVISLANALVKIGVDVSIVTASATTKPLVSPDPRIDIHAYPTPEYYSHQFITPFYVHHFLRHRYDHVVAFFADFGEGAALRIVNRFRDIPLTLYLCYPYSAAPHRYHSFQALGWQQKATLILADATWIAREAEQFFHRPVGVVPVGTDPERFRVSSLLRDRSRKQWGINEGDVVLLNVAALEPRKGITRVIQSMSRLVVRFPQLRYLVLGEGAQERELRRMVAELKLDNVVVFAGTTADLEAYYNAADIFVMLTDDEGNSIACHEAMSSGLPVVVSDTGGFIESVPSTAGFRVSPNDTEEIDDAFSRLITNPLLRQSMGQTGRDHILDNYSWEKTAERFLKELR
jgi:glycosyltransferase involved in cell wall biosynthesis